MKMKIDFSRPLILSFCPNLQKRDDWEEIRINEIYMAELYFGKRNIVIHKEETRDDGWLEIIVGPETK
jgi:hypothetical protein